MDTKLRKQETMRGDPSDGFEHPPTMMRMVVTTPNVFKQRRPEWLGPFNFFLFPMLSEWRTNRYFEGVHRAAKDTTVTGAYIPALKGEVLRPHG
jgi:hypothetical protein